MKILEASLHFLAKRTPLYVLDFALDNGRILEQIIGETEWGQKQMEMYCDYPIKIDDEEWFSTKTLDEANKRLQRLIGLDCGIRISKRGMQYLIIF